LIIFIDRATVVTGHRLSMKTTVVHIPVFLFAHPAHPERGHGGVGPVIRQLPDNGKPRATMGAVDEGVLDAVRLTPHIREALRTYGYIRTNVRDLPGTVSAGDDMEILGPLIIACLPVYAPYTGSLRSISPDL